MKDSLGDYKRGERVWVDRLFAPGQMLCTVRHASAFALRVEAPSGNTITVYQRDAHRVQPLDAITRLGELIE